MLLLLLRCNFKCNQDLRPSGAMPFFFGDMFLSRGSHHMQGYYFGKSRTTLWRSTSWYFGQCSCQEHLEVSLKIGLPLVIIHFQLGFSLMNPPFRGPPWLWTPPCFLPGSTTAQRPSEAKESWKRLSTVEDSLGSTVRRPSGSLGARHGVNIRYRGFPLWGIPKSSIFDWDFRL